MIIKNDKTKNKTNNIIGENKPETVNFHFTEYCNMKCKYCFAKYKNKRIEPLPIHDAKKIIEEIKKSGVKKINFAGGEPLLFKPYLGELIEFSKEIGLIVSIITNGYLLDEGFLKYYKKYIDLIGISIDSLKEDTNLKIGRICNGEIMSENEYLKICELINRYEIKLKINTVVSSLNKNEILTPFINKVSPIRWKIFQVLPIGLPKEIENEVKISDKEYKRFVKINTENIFSKINICIETNELMRESYIMINPEGRLCDNSKNEYSYSDPILKVGFEKALSQINYNHKKFIKRGGKLGVYIN